MRPVGSLVDRQIVVEGQKAGGYHPLRHVVFMQRHCTSLEKRPSKSSGPQIAGALVKRPLATEVFGCLDHARTYGDKIFTAHARGRRPQADAADAFGLAVDGRSANWSCDGPHSEFTFVVAHRKAAPA